MHPISDDNRHTKSHCGKGMRNDLEDLVFGIWRGFGNDPTVTSRWIPPCSNQLQMDNMQHNGTFLENFEKYSIYEKIRG